MGEEKIPAVIYAARSASDDGEKSTRSQIDEVRKRVDLEGGREVIGEFSESGRSGFHGERGPELDAAMAAATGAASDAGAAELWVFHSSRLARGDGHKGKRSLNKIHADLLYEDVQVRSVEDDEFVRNAMLVGIASEQNNKFAKDHGTHIARGKRRASGEGKWSGGPAPDGYITDRQLVDKKIVAKLKLDPERAPVIRAAFDLAEGGMPDAAIVRSLNEAGHRTKNGKAWTLRRVNATLSNPVYAGRIVRWGAGSMKGGEYRRFEEPEICIGEHPHLIEPDRYDVIAAVRADRLSSKKRKTSAPKDRGRLGGRPTTRFALAKLAVCGRCGERMSVNTSKPRTDGTQRRTYVCQNVRSATGLCDQPRLDAEKIDTAVVEYLDRLFVDVDAWTAELERGASGQREAAEAALAAERAELAKLEGREAKLREVWTAAIEAGETRREEIAFDTLEECASKSGVCRERVAELAGTLNAMEEEPSPTDTALDLYNDLVRVVRGGDGSLLDLNERLRSEFEAFELDRVEEGIVGILPLLRERGIKDVRALYRAWEEAGEPDPTAEEIEAYEARERAEEPIWAGKVRPPALPLAVPDNDPNPRYYTK